MNTTAPVQSSSGALSPKKAFAAVFMGVFLIVFISAALITFLMPESFMSVARVRTLTPEQAEIFQSAATLEAVAKALDLNGRFAQRYGESEPLTAEITTDMLRRTMRVSRISKTDLVEIRVYSSSPVEAAELANAIARTGISNAVPPEARSSGAPQFIDQAVPGLRPVRPNKALNLWLGAVVGILLGVMSGGIGAKLALGSRR